MSYILTYVRVALATSDVQSTLEIPATDEIHIGGSNHSFAWTKPNNGIYNTQHRQWIVRKELYKSCGTGTIKGGINLYIELQKHKLDQIAARNMKISIQKRKLHVSEEKYDTRDKNLSTVLANSSDHSRARRHNLECKPVSNTLTVYVIFCPLEVNTWRLKTYLEIKTSQNNTLALGKLQRCQSQRSGNLAGLWPLKICHSTV